MEGQNKSCAYCCRALRKIPKGLVGHLENIRANLENLDVAQIQKTTLLWEQYECTDGFSITKVAECDLYRELVAS